MTQPQPVWGRELPPPQSAASVLGKNSRLFQEVQNQNFLNRESSEMEVTNRSPQLTWQAWKAMSFFQKCLGPHGPRFNDKNPLKQRSPTFLEPGTSFVEDNFSMVGVGVVWDDPRALHLLCTLFLLLSHQLHLRSPGTRSRRLGAPALRTHRTPALCWKDFISSTALRLPEPWNSCFCFFFNM